MIDVARGTGGREVVDALGISALVDSVPGVAVVMADRSPEQPWGHAAYGKKVDGTSTS